MASTIRKSLLVTLTFPPEFGGMQAYYHHLCSQLPADKVVVLAPSVKGEDDFDLNQHYTIVRKRIMSSVTPRWPSGWLGLIKLASTIRWISLIKSIDRAARLHHIEIIQVGQVLPLGTLALWYKRRRGIPYIFYAHGLDIMVPQRFLRKKTLLKKIIAGAEAIVANSEFTKDELIKLGAPREKVTVIYPCPNISATQPPAHVVEKVINTYQLSGKKVLLSISRLVERKGHDMVIKSLPQIIKAVPNIQYVIVGDGPYKKNLERLVSELRLGRYVQFVGARPQSEISAWYELCNAFIMPARQLPNGDVEGFGIVYLEANLYGKPVIAGRSGGVPEAVTDGTSGLLVNPTNTDAIANAAIRLLTDDVYAHRLGAQGLDRVHREFNWETQAKKLQKILETTHQ